MPKQTQAGFSLIEMMIVVAIVGILAAVAMPVYLSDYMARSRVTEGLAMAALAKTVVAENAFNGNADFRAGFVAPTATVNTSSVAVSSAGLITLTFTAKVASGSPTLTLQPQVGGVNLVAGTAVSDRINWVCSGGTLAAKLRPAECR